MQDTNESTAPAWIGILWFICALGTAGYLKLSFWWSVLALVIWPYLLAGALAP